MSLLIVHLEDIEEQFPEFESINELSDGLGEKLQSLSSASNQLPLIFVIDKDMYLYTNCEGFPTSVDAINHTFTKHTIRMPIIL
jgi:hypothetical protein